MKVIGKNCRSLTNKVLITVGVILFFVCSYFVNKRSERQVYYINEQKTSGNDQSNRWPEKSSTSQQNDFSGANINMTNENYFSMDVSEDDIEEFSVVSRNYVCFHV